MRERPVLKTKLALAALLFGLASCSKSPPADRPLQGFQRQDENWRKETLTLGPVRCPDKLTTVLPLAVGADKSRVWTLQLQDGGTALDFRHAHTLKDGSPDPVTGYGGVAISANSSPIRAVFPVDDYSKKNFKDNGLEVSMTNVWSIDIDPGNTMTYSLNREGRNFVAEFDLKAAE